MKMDEFESQGVKSVDLKRIQIRSRRLVTGDMLGQYRSSFRGTGLVYSDLREYQPGDDVKHIHWKVSARTNKVFVKSYEEDRQLRVLLAIDTSASLTLPSNSPTRARLLEFASLVTTLTKRSNDLLGACLFSDTVTTFLQPTSSLSRQHKILTLLSQHDAQLIPRKTDVAASLDTLGRMLRRPTLLFLISDFLSRPFDAELTRVSAQHDVVLVHIEHPSATLPEAGLVTFTDSESGARITVDSSSPTVRRAWEVQRAERRASLTRVADVTNVDVIHIADSAVVPFAQLMMRRTAQRGAR